MTPDFVFKTCTGHDMAYWMERGELDFFPHYANPREDAGKGILSANWNHFPRHTPRDQEFNWSRKGRRFQDALEQMGYLSLLVAAEEDCKTVLKAASNPNNYQTDKVRYLQKLIEVYTAIGRKLTETERLHKELTHA